MRSASTVNRRATWVLAGVCWCALGAVAGAGPLDPPAGPMQGTGRGIILSLPFTITEPGSYVVARDLAGVAGQHGIRILASNVTLDLNGFTIRGVSGSLSGINVEGARTDIAIRNGIVRGWGGRGINAGSCRRARVSGCQIPDNEDDGLCSGEEGEVEDCKASGNGESGIECGDKSKVEGCSADSNDGTGVETGETCIITRTTATGNGGGAGGGGGGGVRAGAGSVVTGCIARGNIGDGFVALDGSVVSSCTATMNSGNGFLVGTGGMLSGSVARANGIDGIRVQAFGTVLGSTCDGNGTGEGTGAGIHAVGTGARIDGNTIILNEVGVLAGAAAGRNIIIRNTLSRSTGQNFDVAPSNTIGEVVSAVNNSSLVATNPWANIVY